MHINCPHFNLCSGCTRNFNIDQLKIFEEAQRFFSSFGISNLKLNAGHACGWRCRAKLAVRGLSENPKIGLFEENSHRVVAIPFCKVHHPAINRAVAVVRAWIIKDEITLYDEQTGKGFLRYLQLAVERDSGRVQLVLVVNEKDKESTSFKEKRFVLDALWEMGTDIYILDGLILTDAKIILFLGLHGISCMEKNGCGRLYMDALSVSSRKFRTGQFRDV